MAHITIPAGEPRVSYTPVSPSTGPFNVTFPIFAESDLNVLVDGSLLSSSDWTFTSTGTVTGGFQTGYITLDVATTDEVVIYRAITRLRTSDYASGPLDMDTLNSDIDRAVARDQDIKMLVDRALRVSLADPAAAALPSAADRAGKYLGFDTNGDPIASAAAVSTAAMSAFFQTLVDDPDAATLLGTLGFSAYTKTLLPAADASAMQTLLGAGAIGKTLFAAATKAAARTALQGPLYFIDDFAGVTGDGTTDDSAAINAAITTVNAAGGGWIIFSEKSYAVSSPIVLKNNVKLLGVGGGQYPAPAYYNSANFLALHKTRIVATGSFSGTAVVQVAATAAAAYDIQGVELSGLMIDCADVAAIGLYVVSAKNCRFTDLLVYRPITGGTGIWEDTPVGARTGTALAGSSSTITLATTATTRNDRYNNKTITLTGGTGSGQSRTISAYVGSTGVATVSANWTTPPDATSTYSITGDGVTENVSGNMFNVWDQITVWCGNAGSARGWVQIGDPSYDVNQCLYGYIKIVCNDGDCLQVWNADDNTWLKVDTFNFGTGVGIRLKGNSRNAVEAGRHNTFVSVQCAGPGSGGTGGLVVENGAGLSAIDNTVVVYDQGNAVPDPIVAAGVRFNCPVWIDFTPTFTFDTAGNLSTSYAVQSGRYRRWFEHIDIQVALQFTPTHTTSSGDARFSLPFPAASGADFGMLVHAANAAFGWPTGKTMLTANAISGQSYAKLLGSVTGGASAFVAVADMASGTAKIVRFRGSYEATQ